MANSSRNLVEEGKVCFGLLQRLEFTVISTITNRYSTLRLKVHITEADWFTEGRQENDWTQLMMSELGLTAWEFRLVVKNRLAARTLRNTGKQANTDLPYLTYT